MAGQDQFRQRESSTLSVDGALVRIGTSTAGGVAVGGAVGALLGIAGSGVGATIGGAIGFIASVADTVRTKSGK
jgi:hypothetical protein